MAFWSAVRRATGAGVTPNAAGDDPDYRPGTEGAIDFVGEDLEQRALNIPAPSAWSGYPENWNVPDWQVSQAADNLVDIAWQCLDLQSNIVSAMPVYQTKNGKIVDPEQWMSNPDPDIYSCWQEFAKQLYWDYQMGEAFVIPMVGGGTSGSYPSRFRVMPPPMVNVDMKDGRRIYKIGSLDVTDDILHIRYRSTTTNARGIGPLDTAAPKIAQVRLLQRYASNLAETGGVPLYWIGVNRRLTPSEGKDLVAQWIETRTQNAGHPAVLGSNATLNQARTMDAKEMALLEISQFSESRIAGLLGVPPFLVGLAGASGSLTYSNISDLFDYHDRSSLRPKTRMIMESLSAWALPRGRAAEFNRDDYTRLPFNERVATYKILKDMGALDVDEIRIMERYLGSTTGAAAQALTGGEN